MSTSQTSEHSALVRPFISWGELLWDLFPDGPRLGGAAANLAYHLARLGYPASLVSRVGDDPLGRRAREELGRTQVNLSLLQQDQDRPTGTVEVSLVDGEPAYRIAEQVAWDRIQVTPELAAALAAARGIAFGTLAQRTPLALTALANALELVPGDCLRLLDLNLRAPWVNEQTLLRSVSLAHLVKLNQAELTELARVFSCENPVGWLLARGVRLVAVTLGAQGSELHTREQVVRTRAVPLSSQTGDRVGAGDAFAAVLLSDFAAGRSLERIATRANTYASRVASARGGMPSCSTSLDGATHDAGK